LWGALRRLGEDADETLDIEPVVFKVVRHIRPKFSCWACETIVQAPAPEKAIARGKASFRMISHVIVSKFDHHLPLYRQAEMMAAQGIDIDRSTLAGWTGLGAALPPSLMRSNAGPRSPDIARTGVWRSTILSPNARFEASPSGVAIGSSPARRRVANEQRQSTPSSKPAN
jgi:Transposase IS66 family/zinc-finger binding domain of transposase IS66